VTEPAPFTCENAAAALGKPDRSAIACAELPESAGIYAVTLEGADGAREGRLVALDAEGFAVTEAGMPAASAWLRDRGLLAADSGLTLTGITNALEAFSAWPPGFDLNARSFEHEELGPSTFSADPFALTLYTLDPQSPVQGPDRFLRAVLALDEGKLVWKMAKGKGGSWTEGASLPAE
jgi:hypothetical protein